jgi:transposase
VIDRKGRPLRFLLSGGQCFDGKAAVPLLKPLSPAKKLLADKAYDCAAFRDWLARRGTTPVIPNKINRRKPFPYNKRAYRHRNKIERMFCRLKDARRIATRYDKCGPELPQRRLLDRRYLLLVKLSLDPRLRTHTER